MLRHKFSIFTMASETGESRRIDNECINPLLHSVPYMGHLL